VTLATPANAGRWCMNRPRAGWHSTDGGHHLLQHGAHDVEAFEGLPRSLMMLAGIDAPTPDHTTRSRRTKGLELQLRRPPSREPIHLVVDARGLGIVGQGQFRLARLVRPRCAPCMHRRDWASSLAARGWAAPTSQGGETVLSVQKALRRSAERKNRRSTTQGGPHRTQHTQQDDCVGYAGVESDAWMRGISVQLFPVHHLIGSFGQVLDQRVFLLRKPNTLLPSPYRPTGEVQLTRF